MVYIIVVSVVPVIRVTVVYILRDSGDCDARVLRVRVRCMQNDRRAQCNKRMCAMKEVK